MIRTRESRPRPLPGGFPNITSDQQTNRSGVQSSPLATVTPLFPRLGEPSTYGLNPSELAAEIRRCRRRGWLRWEVAVRFGRWSA